MSVAIVMAKPSNFYVSVADGSADASGVGEQQTSSALNRHVADGTYTFKIHTTNGSTLGGSSLISVGQVGAMAVSSGAFTGNENTLKMGRQRRRNKIHGILNAPNSPNMDAELARWRTAMER